MQINVYKLYDQKTVDETNFTLATIYPHSFYNSWDVHHFPSTVDS